MTCYTRLTLLRRTEHQFAGKWLAKRGIEPTGTPARLGVIAAKILLLSPLYVAERYGLFCQPELSFTQSLHDLYSRGLIYSCVADGILTELLWAFFAQRFLADVPLRWVMSRINALSRRMDDALVVRRLAVESALGFVATSAFFAAGVVWFAKKR